MLAMKRAILAIRGVVARLRARHTVRMAGERFACDAHHMKFWYNVARGKWEPETLAVLKQHLTSASVYADIGSYIGPTVLYAARRCKRVYCFEPDYVAYRYLLWNIDLNNLRNVLPFNLALGCGERVRNLYAAKYGDMQTSLLGAKCNDTPMQVCCMGGQNG